jgi:sterol desaturase/sphingolipid hydroxylase (fatty acid hydroxylase superfamily)
MSPVDGLIAGFGDLQQWLFESIVQPLLFGIGMGNVLEEAYRATGWLLIGGVQILLLLTLFRALERWRPVEPSTDVRAVRVAMFFTLDALVFDVNGELRLLGWQPWQIDAIWPGVTDTALISFLMYLVLFDFVDYLIHRGQHAIEPWWRLHALHHSQRQMTMWSDNRNHLLDDVIRELIFASVALAVGIGPGQFVAVVACTQLIESLSHANVRMSFGPVFGRLLVSPAYHRLHHAIGIGHESHGQGSLGGLNFAVLFPVWDLLLGTARLRPGYDPTGIRDQLPADGQPGRDYGSGFWSQQWLGLKRLAGRA